VARKIWLGGWNPTRDREPDKKEEQAFKEFLITKYERRNWYKSPSEVAKEEAAPVQEVKTDAKLGPPPSKVRYIWAVIKNNGLVFKQFVLLTVELSFITL
jgi:hypothetical protein